MGIDLEKLAEEVPSPSGKAQKAKAKSTRKLYKSLVRRAAAQEAKTKAVQMPNIETPSTQVQPLGGFALNTDAEFEMSEYFVDSDDYSSLAAQAMLPVSPSPGREPNLGFRVWSPTSSRTKFTNKDGFVSEAFSIWR